MEGRKGRVGKVRKTTEVREEKGGKEGTGKQKGCEGWCEGRRKKV